MLSKPAIADIPAQGRDRTAELLGLVPRFPKFGDQPCREKGSRSLEVRGTLGKAEKEGLTATRSAEID